MAQNKLDKVDSNFEAKGSGAKTLWQLIKFILVSCVATVVQLVTVNLFNVLMSGHFGTVTGIFAHIFNTSTMGAGNNNWGYVLPFLLSNLLAQIVGYAINRKKTFKSDSNLGASFTAYIIIVVALILFNTWLQGLIAGSITTWSNSNMLTHPGSAPVLKKLAVTIASMVAGLEQFVILFPLEKFVLLREKKEEPAEKAAEPAEPETSSKH